MKLLVLMNFDLSNINIVIANVEDIAQLCKLNQDEYWNNIETIDKETLFRLGKWWINPELLLWHMKIINVCKGNILIAKHGDEIIGELDFVQTPDFEKRYFSRLHVIWLIVKKNYRRYGVAKKMILDLKSKFPNKEIWVEPEDDRSMNLYQSIGVNRKNIDTWKVDAENKFSKNDQFHSIEKSDATNYQALVKLIEQSKIHCVVGRFYAPLFDIEQLNRSEKVHLYIWGDTDKAPIIIYKSNNLTLYVVLTQFIRIYADQNKIDMDDFELLLEHIFDETLSLGFEELYIQIYEDGEIKQILNRLGCIIIEENYPVFSL